MLKRSGVFITGTDTGVGKTFIAAHICRVLRAHEKICYFKPIQTGSAADSDTQAVKEQAGLLQDEFVDPSYSFLAPLSPDRAALTENAQIDPQKIIKDFQSLQDRFIIVEGAGGLRVPICDDYKMSDLIKSLGLPVVIVASTRLGTINHTLLTVETAKGLGLEVLGVVLNGEEDPGLRETLESLGVNILFSVPLQTNFTPLTEGLDQQMKDAVKKNAKPSLQKADETYIWHPFTQYGFDHDFPMVVSGKGSLLRLENGEEIVDAISSWWVNLHGHSHPKIADAIHRQAHLLEHAIFSGYTHEPATQLAEKLVTEVKKKSPKMQKVFYSDNGSTAVEVALKMAYQYQKQIGQTARHRFLALQGSYHGDTLAAMSASDRNGFHKVFTPLMAPVDFIAPDDFKSLAKIRDQLQNYAAVIFEPLVQGAGGMRFYSPAFLQELCKICREQGVLLIADEIFTGFYRTGTFLASEQAQIQPDLICLSKGITGGFLPLAVTITTQEIFSAFKNERLDQAFLHGHSYTGNPLACAAALASWDLLQTSSCQEQIQNVTKWTQSAIRELQDMPMVFQARSLGTIGAFEAQENKSYFAGEFSRKFAKACEQRGALIRPLGSTVYTVPPYCTTPDQFNQIYKSIRQTLHDIQRGSL